MTTETERLNGQILKLILDVNHKEMLIIDLQSKIAQLEAQIEFLHDKGDTK